jgi:hypothetical protein
MFAGIVVCLTILANFSFGVLSSMRTYVGGASLFAAATIRMTLMESKPCRITSGQRNRELTELPDQSDLRKLPTGRCSYDEPTQALADQT